MYFILPKAMNRVLLKSVSEERVTFAGNSWPSLGRYIFYGVAQI
jgi:hypothetical protein